MMSELPELPPTKVMDGLARLYGRPEFTAAEMQAYARQAVAAEREAIAAEWERLHGFDKYGVAAFVRAAAIRKETL